MPTLDEIIEAWNEPLENVRWFIRRNKMHDTKQWEVVHDWGGDTIDEETMEVIGRFHDSRPAGVFAYEAETKACAISVRNLFRKHNG